MTFTLLPNWTSEHTTKFRREVLVAPHRLRDSGLFERSKLEELLNDYPLEDLGISTMGTDPSRPSDWASGEPGSLNGAELMEAVQRGRLWLNLRRVTHNCKVIGELVDQLYGELESHCRNLQTFNHSANLLISSPSAIVYYHMDCPFNMLWHITGTKRVWAYPTDEECLPVLTREDVLSGDSTEEIPYTPSLDDRATIIDLEPDQLVTWPLHSPHRVVNTSGINVSLSTEHYTKEALRTNNVLLANRYFRKWNRRWAESTETSGLSASLKEAAIRLVRRIPPLAPKSSGKNIYPKSFIVDLDAENCVRFTNEATNELSAV